MRNLVGILESTKPIHVRPNVKGIKCIQEGAMELGIWWEEPSLNRLWYRIPWEERDAIASPADLTIMENIPLFISSMISVGDLGLWCWLVAARLKIVVDDRTIPEYITDNRMMIPPHIFKQRIKNGTLDLPKVDVVILSNLGRWNQRWFEPFAKKMVIVYSLGNIDFLKQCGYQVKGFLSKEYVAWKEMG